MKAIAAMSLNRIIGNKGKIPWHLPEDLRFFKQTTMHGTLVMGRKTFESVGWLKNRSHYVITKDEELLKKETCFNDDHFMTYITAWDFLMQRKDLKNVWVCGGAEIYRIFMPWVDELYLTLVLESHKGDTWMPEFETLFTKTEIIEREEKYMILRYYR